MAPALAQQLARLQQIASFSAAVRGHQLGAWQTQDGWAAAECVRCGAELRVYFPALQPEVNGPALEHSCTSQAAAGQAA